MEKYFVEWNGKKFPVRKVELPEALGGFVANVADIELWEYIEDAYDNGEEEAHAIDNDIYFYCEHRYVASGPTDKEIIDYLIIHGC